MEQWEQQSIGGDAADLTCRYVCTGPSGARNPENREQLGMPMAPYIKARNNSWEGLWIFTVRNGCPLRGLLLSAPVLIVL